MNKYILGIVVLALGVAAGWYVLSGSGQNVPSTPSASVTRGTQEPSPTMMPYEYTETSVSGVPGSEGADKGGVTPSIEVRLGENGFSPSPISVKKGTKVVFLNDSTGSMWVASAVHPTHQLLAGFDQLKSVAKSGSYEYVFEQVGSWKYHNHVNPTQTGMVVVTE